MSRDETWRQAGAVWAYHAVELGAMMLPETLGRRLFTAGGRVAHRYHASLRQTVAANLAQVLGGTPADAHIGRTTREAFELYAQYWHGTFYARRLTDTAVVARTAIDTAPIDTALARGRGCILVSPHLGNWDIAGRFFAARGYRIAAVAEALRPARLADLFERHRRALGVHIVRLVDGRQVVHELRRLLADNWIVALIADRDLTGHGVEVTMFDRPRRLPVGPAVLAMTTGAPLLAGAAYASADGWASEIHGPLTIDRSGDPHADVRALTQRMATVFDHLIATRPADWHVFECAWPTDAP